MHAVDSCCDLLSKYYEYQKFANKEHIITLRTCVGISITHMAHGVQGGGNSRRRAHSAHSIIGGYPAFHYKRHIHQSNTLFCNTEKGLGYEKTPESTMTTSNQQRSIAWIHDAAGRWLYILHTTYYILHTTLPLLVSGGAGPTNSCY